MIVLLMGVSGSGKTTIGQMLSHQIDAAMVDADDYHSPANKARMQQGEALTDADRQQWLDALSRQVLRLAAGQQHVVLACSALKQQYRARLMRACGEIKTVYLRGRPDLMQQRVAQRSGHFFPASLVASQFEILEEPADALTANADDPPDVIVQTIRRGLGI